MRSKRLKMVGAATVGALALSVTGLAGTAQADLADDVAIMVENLPEAVDVLVAAAQTTAENFVETPTTMQLATDLMFAVRDGVGAVVAGTEQFGALGFGAALFFGAPLSILQPYLTAIDNDPATLVDLIDVNEIVTVVGNIPAAVAGAQPHVTAALAHLIQGELVAGTGFTGGFSFPNGSLAAASGPLLSKLVEGTSMAFTVPLAVGIMLLVPSIAAAGYVADAEAGLAPVFEALAPVTTPVAELLANL